MGQQYHCKPVAQEMLDGFAAACEKGQTWDPVTKKCVELSRSRRDVDYDYDYGGVSHYIGGGGCKSHCNCPPYQTWNEAYKKCVYKSDLSDDDYVDDYDATDVDKDNCNVNEYFSEEQQRCVPTNRANENSQDNPRTHTSCKAHEVWSDNQQQCVPINPERSEDSTQGKGGTTSVSRSSLLNILIFTFASIML